MSSSNTPARSAAALPVRSRTTVEEGAVTVSLGVACPASGTDVPPEECGRCAHGGELRIDAEADDLFVCCRFEGAADPLAGQATIERSSRRPDAADLTPVSVVMTTHVTCVRAGLSVAALQRLLLERGVTGVPVVDAEGRPIGVVSSTDVLRFQSERSGADSGAEAVVDDIMTPMAFCLPSNAPIAKAAALMAFEGIHRLPVVGPTGHVVGILSPLDVLRWLAREHGYVIASQR